MKAINRIIKNKQHIVQKARVLIDFTIDENQKHPALVRKDKETVQLLKKVGIPSFWAAHHNFLLL
jgi:hypothetical protein